MPCPRRYLIVIALGAAIAAGCSDPAPDEEPGLPMTFGAGTDSGLSRGYATTAANMHSFAVSATLYSAQGDRTLYFAHEQYRFSYEGQDVSRTVEGTVHYWRQPTDEYNFYAYTPSPYIYFESGVVDKFIYTTPGNVADQPDIMVATSIAATYGQPVSLRFTHPLAQISIYEGPVMRRGRILSITFSGIIEHGEYNMLTGEWLMLSSDTASFVWNCDAVTHADTNLTDEYYNFFFIPQQLGASAAITVVFEDALGVIETHRVSLSGMWQAGHHYRYSLSLP